MEGMICLEWSSYNLSIPHCALGIKFVNKLFCLTNWAVDSFVKTQ